MATGFWYPLLRFVSRGMKARSGPRAQETSPVGRTINMWRNRHTMNRRWNIIAAVALVFVAAIACAKAPQEDVDSAKAEMDRARQAQSETWAPNEFQAADQAMSAADAEMQAQHAKWIK